MSQIDPLFEQVDSYVKTSYELYRLKTIKKTAEVISSFIANGAILVVFFMFILFISISLSFWLGDLLGENYLGFLCVSAIYVVLGAVLTSLSSNYIKPKISNAFIEAIFSK